MTRAARLESDIQAEILRTFGALPWLRIWRSNSGAMRDPSGRLVRFNFKGYPDISGFLAPNGRALYIEVKSATGRQTQEQKAFQAICGKFGAIYILARSVADVWTGLHSHNFFPPNLRP